MGARTRLPFYLAPERTEWDRVCALPGRQTYEGILVNEQLVHARIERGEA